MIVLPRQRQRKITEIVSEQDGQSVDELAGKLDVSKATVRRDLSELADEGLVKRSHGGAIPVRSVRNEQSYGQKEVQYLEEKQAIADSAVEEIQRGEVVFFDSGTTTMEVAKRAPSTDTVISITNSPLIAFELRERDGEVLLTGGSLRQRTQALVGPTAEQFIKASNFDTLFLGTNGIGESGVLTTPTTEEAQMKKLMLERSKRIVLVSIASKIGTRTFKQFGTLEDVDLFITDERMESEHRQWFDEANVHVLDGVAE